MNAQRYEQDVLHARASSRTLEWVRGVLAFCRNRPLGAFGGMIILVFTALAILAPVVATRDPVATDFGNLLRAPGREFFFGTDHFGRDQFSRVVYGARVSLYVSLLAVISSTVLGTFTGVISAYFGGRFDLIVQRVVDIMQGVPSLVLMMALVVALGASVNNVTMAIAVSYVGRMVRVARAQALSTKEHDFVLAAEAAGAGNLRIVLRHLVPNSLTPSIVVGTALLGAAIVSEAALSFLGLGVPPPHPSWGRMLQFGARGYMEIAPWLVIFPGLALTIAVLAVNLFGDALRDSLDPRLRGGR